jgi:biopolymer transport protein ExbD
MNGQRLVTAWIDRVAPRVIQRAARNVPQPLAERVEEEWLADLAEQHGRISQLSFALGCYWAATVIRHGHCAQNAPATSAPMEYKTMTAHAYQRASLFPRRTTSGAPGNVMCDINITPLIDVMLVLLVTLVVSLPIMTHAVKLDLPQAPPSDLTTPPEVIDLDIDFDGTVVWNGQVVAGLQQLESYLHAAAQKEPQPEIHLRADRGVKYDYVAQVLASAQHNHMRKMGFVNTSDFKN